MKKHLILFFLVFVPFWGEAQVNNPAFNLLLKNMLSENVPTISVKTAYKLKSNPIYLDARELEEYNVSHIENAIWVGYNTFDLTKVNNINKDRDIIIYCSIGYRSGIIGEKLQDAGYKSVKNLYGSIFEWSNEGLPLYDKNNKPTNKVHAYNKRWGVWVNKGEKVY